MVRYDVRCPDGHRFEVELKSIFSDNPECIECGQATARVPAVGAVRGVASAGVSRDQVPNTWRGIDRGNPDAVRYWHQQVSKREKLEAKYPGLAGDRRPVLAHEGAFASQPLRAGDPMAEQVAAATFGPAATPPPAKSANQPTKKDQP